MLNNAGSEIQKGIINSGNTDSITRLDKPRVVTKTDDTFELVFEAERLSPGSVAINVYSTEISYSGINGVVNSGDIKIITNTSDGLSTPYVFSRASAGWAILTLGGSSLELYSNDAYYSENVQTFNGSENNDSYSNNKLLHSAIELSNGKIVAIYKRNGQYILRSAISNTAGTAFNLYVEFVSISNSLQDLDAVPLDNGQWILAWVEGATVKAAIFSDNGTQYSPTFTIAQSVSKKSVDVTLINSSRFVVAYDNLILKTVEIVDFEADSDGDGTLDYLDDFPNDPMAQVSSKYPVEDTVSGSLLFEDGWPSAGDFDLNDVYMGYKFELMLNQNNEVAKLKALFMLRAAGSGFRNGFGIQFPDINLADIQSVVFKRNGIVVNENFPSEPGQSKPTYLIAPNLYGDIPGNDRLVNVSNTTGFTVNLENMPYYELVITFSTPQASVGYAPFNPFITINQERGREVHLPNFSATDLANPAYFGTVSDAVNGQGQSVYLTSGVAGQAGLPWAIDIPEEFEAPLEKVDIVQAYPSVVNWAQSATFSNNQNGAWLVADPELSVWYQSGNNDKRRQVKSEIRTQDQLNYSGEYGF